MATPESAGIEGGTRAAIQTEINRPLARDLLSKGVADVFELALYINS
jgi:hypothetical protein